jgi:hypothetical protein
MTSARALASLESPTSFGSALPELRAAPGAGAVAVLDVEAGPVDSVTLAFAPSTSPGVIAVTATNPTRLDLNDRQFGIKIVEIPVRWWHEYFRLQSTILLVRLHRPAEQFGMSVDYEDAHLQRRRRQRAQLR